MQIASVIAWKMEVGAIAQPFCRLTRFLATLNTLNFLQESLES